VAKSPVLFVIKRWESFSISLSLKEIVDADPTLSGHVGLREELELLLSPEDEEFLFKN